MASACFAAEGGSGVAQRGALRLRVARGEGPAASPIGVGAWPGGAAPRDSPSLLASIAGARTGSVGFPQRFGSSLNVHVHFHTLAIDGVFEKTAAGNRRRFREDRHGRALPRCAAAFKGRCQRGGATGARACASLATAPRLPRRARGRGAQQ
ncbi:transposase [Sorangium sp. So ce375]|uniref:transposase n=1 Tax=Sorangium sp. So ce375 TaxID=3133306 RepID=UPI003F5B8784